MKAGEKGTVFEITGGFGLQRRLEAMGIRLGSMIERVTDSPFGGPVVIRIRRMRLAIGRGMADRIMVQVERTGPS